MIHLPHLETDLTQACQLSCVGCNHSVPLWRHRKGGPWSADPAQVELDLNRLAKIAHSDVWAALGGEPTLHPKVVEILGIARRSRIGERIEVWTNGISLQKMHREFWESFDVLVLSIYEDKLADDALDWIRNRCHQAGVELVEKDERTWHNFRTMLEPVPTDAAATKAKYNGCFFRMFSRAVSYGYFFTCCCGPHLPMLVQDRNFGEDGIAIDGITEEALHNYLTRKEPLGACTICAGRDTAKPITWHEVKDPVRWLNASKGL
jgi:cyclic pyranopterin phosphate synthase